MNAILSCFVALATESNLPFLQSITDLLKGSGPYLSFRDAVLLAQDQKRLKDFLFSYQIRTITDSEQMVFYSEEDIRNALHRQGTLEADWPNYVDYFIGAEILGVKRQALVKWTERHQFMEIVLIKMTEGSFCPRDVKHLQSSRLLRQLERNPFFIRPHFKTNILTHAFQISPQALFRWHDKGKIKFVRSPGGKPYIFYDQLPTCFRLVLDSRRLGPHRFIPEA